MTHPFIARGSGCEQFALVCSVDWFGSMSFVPSSCGAIAVSGAPADAKQAAHSRCRPRPGRASSGRTPKRPARCRIPAAYA